MFSEDSWTCLPLLTFHLDEHVNVCVTHQERGPFFTSVSTLSCLACHCLPLHSAFSTVFCRGNFRLASVQCSVSFRWLCHISLCFLSTLLGKKDSEVAQLCPTLCDPINCSLLGSSVHGILEWVAISFSRGSSPPGIKPGSPALQADSTIWATRGLPYYRNNFSL